MSPAGSWPSPKWEDRFQLGFPHSPRSISVVVGLRLSDSISDHSRSLTHLRLVAGAGRSPNVADLALSCGIGPLIVNRSGGRRWLRLVLARTLDSDWLPASQRWLRFVRAASLQVWLRLGELAPMERKRLGWVILASFGSDVARWASDWLRFGNCSNVDRAAVAIEESGLLAGLPRFDRGETCGSGELRFRNLLESGRGRVSIAGLDLDRLLCRDTQDSRGYSWRPWVRLGMVRSGSTLPLPDWVRLGWSKITRLGWRGDSDDGPCLWKPAPAFRSGGPGGSGKGCAGEFPGRGGRGARSSYLASLSRSTVTTGNVRRRKSLV